MWKKKLITLAGALGILAFGACFAPPPRRPGPPRPETLPPVRESLHGIHDMIVEVSSRAGSPHLNPDEFAKVVAWVINSRRSESHFVAAVGGISKPEAHLQILILNETASHAEGSPNWLVSVDASSSVIARDGRVLWGDRDVFSVELPFPEKDADPVWHDPQLRNGLAEGLVSRMLYWK